MSTELPPFRRLRGYAFDPSLSIRLDTAWVNEAVFKIRWENDLQPGPVGEYLEIVDYDPASKCFYAPVDLNCPFVLAQDGLQPSESNPQFHQQMVYAVTMTTIGNFERALGRKALWSTYRNGRDGGFLPQLRIYPHALREANAYYSPAKKAILFGYFPASDNAPGEHYPNGVVFTCLSHDIIAHETTHALLDGMHRRFVEDSHPDSLAFHEAFADIVALFQHFSFAEVLRHQIAKTHGDLASQNLLGELAHQFGESIGHYGALRQFIGTRDKKDGKWKPRRPDPSEYQELKEPHARGALLVAAVFEAFLSIYKCRVADLLRLATGGTGRLPEGELHPDLVNRLAHEAAKTAQHILNICIRALDYCPPVDISFGDYLRALITADIDLVPNDDLHYRVAIIEAFKRRGIYPRDIRTLSEESLCWKRAGSGQRHGIFKEIARKLRGFVYLLGYLDEFPANTDLIKFFGLNVETFEIPANISEEMSERKKIHKITKAARIALHDLLEYQLTETTEEETCEFEAVTGLCLKPPKDNHPRLEGLKLSPSGRYSFEIHSLRGTRRVGPEGEILNQVIISITQKRKLTLEEAVLPADLDEAPALNFRGGCTLIFDLQDLRLRYVIKKPINDEKRLKRQREYRAGGAETTLRTTYFGNPNQDKGNDGNEPFAFLHRSF
jgi:hypothetical protein